MEFQGGEKGIHGVQTIEMSFSRGLNGVERGVKELHEVRGR